MMGGINIRFIYNWYTHFIKYISIFFFFFFFLNKIFKIFFFFFFFYFFFFFFFFFFFLRKLFKKFLFLWNFKKSFYYLICNIKKNGFVNIYLLRKVLRYIFFMVMVIIHVNNVNNSIIPKCFCYKIYYEISTEIIFQVLWTF